MPAKSSDPTLDISPQPSTGWPTAAHDGHDEPETPSPPEPLDAPWLATATWAVPTLFVAAAGLAGITSPGLWEDELATWGMVTTPWPQFWSVLASTDAVIGPYYVLMRLWSEVAGTSDLMLRLPSVAAMAAAAGLLAALGTRLGGLRVGLAAGMLFAVLPATSRYAQEARPYALAVFAAVLATVLLVRLLDRPGFLRYAAYAGAVALLGLSHAVALLLLGAHGIVVWKMRERTRTVFAWLGAAAVGLLAVLPVLYLGLQQTDVQIAWIPPVTVERIGDTPRVLFGGAVIAGAVMALALLAMSMEKPVVVATTWALAPAAGLLVAAKVAPLWIPRFLLFSLPAWALLASMALRRSSILRGLGAVLAIGLLALPAHLDIRRPAGHQQATKEVAAVLAEYAWPGDVIVYGSYTNGDQRTSRDAVMRYLSPDQRPADPLMQRPPRTDGKLGAQECPDRDVQVCLGEPLRVWIVRKGTLDNPLAGLGAAKEVTLKAGYNLQQSWSVKGFTVAVLMRAPKH